MTWFRVDDDLPEHVKADALIEACGEDKALLATAWAAWLHLGCDCAKRRTDGRFNRARAHHAVRLPPDLVDRAVEMLVVAGLIDRDGTGYVFHDWTDYQPTKAEIDAQRKAATERQKKSRANRASVKVSDDVGVSRCDASVTDAVTPTLQRRDAAVTDAVTTPVTEPVTHANAANEGDVRLSHHPDPTRPVPSEEEKTEGLAPLATPGVPPSAVNPSSKGATGAPQRPSSARKGVAPTLDTIPLPGSPERALYDAIVNDPALRPITVNPGDFATRSLSGAYPGVDVLAEVKRAGEYASERPGKYTDGRAYLRRWFQRKADDVARAPKPAPLPTTKPTTTPSPLLDRPLTAAERAANGARLRDALAASRAATPPTPGDTAP